MAINYTIEGSVGSIVIDHGEGNRIDWDFVEGLRRAAGEAAQSAARVVVIKAVGQDFSGGGAEPLFGGKDLNQIRSTIRVIEDAFALVESIPVPTIAAVQGRAWGGGFELALRADLILADQEALFRFPETTVGVLPLAGGAQRLAARVGVAVANRLVLQAREVSAAELDAEGVVTATPAGSLVEHTAELAAQLATGPTQAYIGAKAVLAAWTRSGLAAADEVMVDQAARLFATEDIAAAATGSAFVGR